MTDKEVVAIAHIIAKTRSNRFVKASPIAKLAMDEVIWALQSHFADCVDNFDHTCFPFSCGRGVCED